MGGSPGGGSFACPDGREGEGGVKPSLKEPLSLRAAKMEISGESTLTCRDRHPCLQHRIFQVLVCSSVCGTGLQKREAAAHSAV